MAYHTHTDIAEGIAHCVDAVGRAEHGIESYEAAESEMRLSAMYEESDWQKAIDLGYVELNGGVYRLSDEGLRLFRRL